MMKSCGVFFQKSEQFPFLFKTHQPKPQSSSHIRSEHGNHLTLISRYPSSHNHGSKNGSLTFQIQPFSTSMIMEERVFFLSALELRCKFRMHRSASGRPNFCWLGKKQTLQSTSDGEMIMGKAASSCFFLLFGDLCQIGGAKNWFFNVYGF